MSRESCRAVWSEAEEMQEREVAVLGEMEKNRRGEAHRAPPERRGG